jgi:RNA polymerase sigma-70 factor (ECF subfamily)
MSQQASPDAGNENGRQQPSLSATDLPGLVAAHHAAVYRYAFRLCGSSVEAEDLSQQAFLIAQQKLHQLREPQRAGAWLLAIVRSCFWKSLRKHRQTPAHDPQVAIEQVPCPPTEPAPIDREELANGLAELSDEFRVVLLMFYFEELSYQQIAEQLEVPIGTVMSRLSRAKGHLRRRLTASEEQTSKVQRRQRAFPTSAIPTPASVKTANQAIR